MSLLVIYIRQLSPSWKSWILPHHEAGTKETLTQGEREPQRGYSQKLQTTQMVTNCDVLIEWSHRF